MPSLFENLDPARTYEIKMKGGRKLFTFVLVHSSNGSVQLRILDGAEAHKTVDLDAFDKPALFTIVDAGPAPQISSVRTAAYREPGMTAAERAEARREGELRSAAMAHIQARTRVESNNSLGLVPTLEDVEEANDTMASVVAFWGLTRVPEERRRCVIRGLALIFGRSAHNRLESANRVMPKHTWNAAAADTLDKAKIRMTKSCSIDPGLVDWTAPFTKYENLALLEQKRKSFFDMSNAPGSGPPSRGSSVSPTLSIKNSNNNNNNSTNGVVGNNFSPRSVGGRKRKTRKSKYTRR